MKWAWLLLFVCVNGWAATYYLDTSCANNGNGTGGSGACAASAGAAGAYNTGASIVYGSGDTIYIKRGTTVTNFPTPVSQPVTIDDYGDSSASCPVISKDGATFALSVSGAAAAINDVCITGDNSSAILNIAAANVTLSGLAVYDNLTGTAVGVRFNTGSGGSSISNSTVHTIADDGIGVGSGVAGTITITDVTCYNVDLSGNETGDCMQAYTGTSASVIVDGGSFTRETSSKQALAYDGSGTFTVRGAPVINVEGGAQGIQIAGSGAFSIDRAYIKGSSSSSKLVQITTTGTGTINSLITDGGIDGVYVSHASGAVNLYNSTIVGASNAAVYHTTGGTLNVRNSYLDADTIALQDASAGATTTADYNRYGISAWKWDGGTTITDIATWQSTSSQDTNSSVATPLFVGGTSPSTAEGFRLTCDSPLRNTGTDVGRFTDYGGRLFAIGRPSIGAWEHAEGDERCTITERTTPTARTTVTPRTTITPR